MRSVAVGVLMALVLAFVMVNPSVEVEGATFDSPNPFVSPLPDAQGGSSGRVVVSQIPQARNVGSGVVDVSDAEVVPLLPITGGIRRSEAGWGRRR